MTRYTELRHAGYYQPGLTDQQRDKIAAQVDNAPTRTTPPNGSTTSQNLAEPAEFFKPRKAR